SYVRAEHQIEWTRFGQVGRAAAWTLHTFRMKGFFDCGARRGKIELVGPQATVALTAINQRIAERVFMSRIFPHQPVQNDRRIDSFDVIAVMNHPAPPRRADIVAE